MELKDFLGRWRIDRRIANAIGADAQFSGVAEFTGDAARLVLEERGEMRLEGQGADTPAMQATRRYHWQQGRQGIEVFFDDGRFFHLIGPDAEVRARHDCAPDLYQVAYDFRTWPQWSSVWSVTGPRKDYRMETRYAPMGAGD